MTAKPFIARHGVQLLDTMDVNGNVITTTVLNGNVVLTPNGTGKVQLDSLTFPKGTGTSNNLLKTDGTGAMYWGTVSFSDLGGTPSLGQNAGKYLKINATEDGLVYHSLATVAETGSYSDLLNTPTYALENLTNVLLTSTADKNILKYNSSNSKWVNGTLSIAEISDGPGAFATGNALQAIRVKANHTALEYFTLATVATTGSYSDLLNLPVLRLDHLLDVSIVSPDAKHFLEYNSTTSVWENKRVNFTDLADAPSSLSSSANKFVRVNSGGTALTLTTLAAVALSGDLGDLVNVTLTTPASGQVLKFNGLKWVNDVVASRLSDLTDVAFDTLTNNNLLKYNSTDSKWENKTLSFLELNDVPSSYTSQTNKFLRVASNGSGLVFATLATIATTGSYSDLSGKPPIYQNLYEQNDVAISSASSGQFLEYNGTKWANSSISLSNLSDVSLGTYANNQVLKYVSADSKWENVSLATVAYSGSYNDLTNKPTLTTALASLTDVSLGTLSNKQALVYISADSKWENSALSTVAFTGAYSDLSGKPQVASAFTGLTDAPSSYASTDAGKFVQVNSGYTGLQFTALATVATSGSYADLSNKPTLGSTSLSGLTDVTLGTLTNNQVLSYNTTDSKWENVTLSYNSLANKPTLTTALASLTDVTVATLVNGQVLTYNSTDGKWENSTPTTGTIQGGSNIGTAGTGIYKDVSGSSLEFYKLNSLTSGLSIALDSTNNKVDFSITSLDMSTASGTLSVGHGGTGLTTITANTIPYGNGTSALNLSSAPTVTNTFFRWNGTSFDWATFDRIQWAATNTSVQTNDIASTITFYGNNKPIAHFYSDSGATVGERVDFTNSSLTATVQAKTTAGTEDVNLVLLAQNNGYTKLGSTAVNAAIIADDNNDLTISGGNSATSNTTAGSLNMQGGAGTANNADGGNVYISGGLGNGSGSNGYVSISDAVVSLRYTKVTATGSYSATIGDYVILIKKTASEATTVYLPAGTSAYNGKVYVIKDGKGDATTNNITISANGADKIDGASTSIISNNYESVTIFWNETEWSII